MGDGEMPACVQGMTAQPGQGLSKDQQGEWDRKRSSSVTGNKGVHLPQTVWKQ